ncbi:MAG: serine/threonine-protein kinase PknK, partial [Leptospiraceae bacterium]|nr:serine/threonine-protein kinase PknK [Leptospiraceae bacterium]
MITIPGYEIDAELYQSAGSLIYRARHNHRTLVIKLPRNEYPTPGEIARYQHEYELVRKLNKQNMSGVVQMIALERQERRPVLIEAYVPGEPLRELLLRETPKLFSVLDMAASFLRCLINLHDNGILHLDIQPSNLIWDREQKEITLIDFGSATFLAHQNPEVIGVDQADLVRLAHISPEQSGRMNRPVDYRSDFYSFGILLFELLTGRVPFESADPLELVHSHLARTAPRANKFNSHVPEQLAEITARLLAKNPEDRYQSAEGILHDLETCRRHLLANGQIPAFTPGEKDVSDRFRLSHKLYGRRTEFEEIDRILNELKNGTAALLLLQGEAGIGKTALASAMQRRLPVIQGRMISGQYDEIKNNQPYSALITALQDLTRQLLTESEERLQAWRALINDALGDRISELLDVLPGLEAVLGARSLPDNGSPAQEPGSRFQSLLVQFVKLFAREESPLVLFLDDIQWIDRSSVDFLHGLYTDPELRFILIVCAYRPQEVPSNHPFQQLLDRIRRNGYEWFSIQPRALDIGDIVRLLADSLGNAREDCRYLAEVVYQKTGGNPFFIREFLTHLSESRLIYYEDHWRWDLNRIQSTGITENIVELMGERIRALPEATQRVVRLSACLGSRFYIDTLAGVYGSDEESTIHDLIPAINEGMILFGDESASFVHDRIRQAAYHQLSADERKQAHYRAGQILLNNSPDDLLKKRIFVITDHLNEAIDLITESKDRLQLARFNLLAGKRSRQAAAHDAARTYFERGMSLLPEDHWSSHPELSRDLFFSRAESEFINNNLEQADNFFQILLKHVENLKDRLRIYESLVALHTSQNRPETALRIGREALRHAGIELPHEHETGRLRFWRQYIRLRWMLSRRTDSELINAPQVRDSVQQVAMRILVNCATPAAQINRHYYYGLVVRMMLFILECGNVECSPCVFAMYASLNISRF